MADLAVTDWNVAFIPRGRSQGTYDRRVVADLTIGDGSKTVPAGGVIPLPDKSVFGFHKILREINIMQPTNGYILAPDIANHQVIVLWGDYSNTSDGPLVPAVGATPAQFTVRMAFVGE